MISMLEKLLDDIRKTSSEMNSYPDKRALEQIVEAIEKLPEEVKSKLNSNLGASNGGTQVSDRNQKGSGKVSGDKV